MKKVKLYPETTEVGNIFKFIAIITTILLNGTLFIWLFYIQD